MNILDINVDVQTIYINTKNKNVLTTSWTLTKEGNDTPVLSWTSDSNTFVSDKYFQSLSIDTSSASLENNATYILVGTLDSNDTNVYKGKVLAVDYTETGYMTINSTNDYITYN